MSVVGVNAAAFSMYNIYFGTYNSFFSYKHLLEVGGSRAEVHSHFIRGRFDKLRLDRR